MFDPDQSAGSEVDDEARPDVAARFREVCWVDRYLLDDGAVARQGQYEKVALPAIDGRVVGA